jgi:4-hydroxy 2-oxovalerate aldolase
MIPVLDCTLRDGGYFNDWNFTKDTAFSLIDALRKSGVHLIEVGFKSPHTHKSKEFEGLFRYCNESLLSSLISHKDTRYSFMVDAKEFLVDGKVDPALVRECIPERSESVFSFARVATYYASLPGSLDLMSTLRDKGYNATINLMGMSLLSEKDFDNSLQLIADAKPHVFYFSDTFGDLVPDQIAGTIDHIRKIYNGFLGIHTHDNNGLAFANTIKAIEYDIDFVDSTVMGMGRGAGNLRTEQLLLYLYFKQGYTHLNPGELLDVIDTHLVPLHNTYHWGWDYTYMLSAMQNIHPMYCQNLRSTRQYTIEQVSRILTSIATENRASFSERALMHAIDSVVNQPVTSEEELIEVPVYTPEQFDDVLVIASGPSRETYKDEISSYITMHGNDWRDRETQPLVLECNPVGTGFDYDYYYSVILNWVRLRSTIESKMISAPIITGISKIPESLTRRNIIKSFPVRINKGEFSVSPAELTIPSYVVGMFSIGLALLSSPKVIHLVGFDGYDDKNDPRYQEMDAFLKKVSPLAKIVSLTPTHYSLIKESIYRYID